jgi:predicted nuclease of restriction endonuclease-like (RecB) superfamily
MKRDRRIEIQADSPLAGYNKVLTDVVRLLESGRRAAAWSVNSIMTATYWMIGRRIVEFNQRGQGRAPYGNELIVRLSADLKKRYGQGFGRMSLYAMRQFYLEWRDREILQTLSGEFEFADLTQIFPLPWSHYVSLLPLKNQAARAFYEKEAVRGGWMVRQLERQIESQFYERTALSKDKAAMLRKGSKAQTRDAVSAEEEIKDPFVLEFLGLKDEYSESDLEERLIIKLQHFLMELGSDFAFVGRQRRLRIGNAWYRVVLLFFHRRLRCVVVIDLKLGKFTHADAGQMHMYLNYARKHWTNPDENPPVGLILCAQKDAAVAHYALDGLPNKVLAAEYRLNLPDEKTLVAELNRTRKMLEGRKSRTTKSK